MTAELIVCPGCDKPRPTTSEGCHHCHHPSYFAENIHRRWRQARPASDQYAVNMNRALRLLRALALEIDERVATRTGEQVCRACGGRGEVIIDAPDGHGSRFWWFEDIGNPHGSSKAPAPRGAPDRTERQRINDAINNYQRNGAEKIQRLGRFTIYGDSVVTADCACDGPTRPVTVSLHDLVQRLAGRPPPDENPSSFEPMRDIPERWLVDVDAMEAAGWRDVVLPSTKADHAARCKWWNENRNRLSTPAERDDNGSGPQPHHPGRHGPRVTPAWQCRWWRAWSAWARGGETPDADALARDLLRLVRESEERRRYLAVIDGTDGLSLREGAQALSTMTGTPVEECESSMRAAMGRVLLPAFGDMIDAVHEFMGEHEATVAATVPSLLDRITSTEAPAEPQRGGPPVGGRLARRLRKRRE